MSAGRDLGRLAAIADELAVFGPAFEQVVHDAIKAEYAYRKAEAGALLVARGKNAAERQADAVMSLVNDGWFDARAVAEAKRRGMEARFRVWESEKSALQTKLKVEVVELGGG